MLNQALAHRDAGDVTGAQQVLEAGIARLRAYAQDEQIADALNLLASALLRLGEIANYPRTRKALRSEGASFSKMSSSEPWSANQATPAPSFKRSRPKTPPAPDAFDPTKGQPK